MNVGLININEMVERKFIFGMQNALRAVSTDLRACIQAQFRESLLALSRTDRLCFCRKIVNENNT